MDELPRPPVDDAEIYAIARPHRNLLMLYGIQSCAGLVIAPLIFIPLFFKYHTLRYKLDGEGISASWGLLFKREIHLTYKRIQDIHVKRNFVERWLGIATVEVQTASGSSSAELSLEGMDDFAAVRDFLYRRMRGHAQGTASGQSAGIEQTAGTASGTASGTAAGGASAARTADTRELLALLDAMREDLDGARRALEQRS